MAFSKKQWYKFYTVLMSNKHYPTPAGMCFVKFGVTHHMKVEHRFDPSVDDGYEKNYDDWNIDIKFSIACETKTIADNIENYYLQRKYPYKSRYKVWVEDVLGIPQDNNKYYNNTGITELRYMPIEEAKRLFQSLNNRKKQMEKPLVTEQSEIYLGKICQGGDSQVSSSAY